MKRKVNEIILYRETNEPVRVSIYKKIIDTSTTAGHDEYLGLAEYIAENGEHINVDRDGDELIYKTLRYVDN